MKAVDALQIQKGDVVSLVGAGGKTSLMFTLGREAGQAGLKTIITTTTKIYSPPAMAVVVSEQRGLLIKQINLALSENNVVVAGKYSIEAQGSSPPKLLGLDSDLIDALRETEADFIVVEADGAAEKPFKAPADHEPVIPGMSTLVVPVVGVKVLNKPLDGQYVHRPEVVADIANVAMGEPVTPEIVANVLTSLKGYRKGIPPSARWVPFINQAETPEELYQARQITAEIKKTVGATVLIGAAREADPVREKIGPVTAVLLAAGRSARLGTPKQLLSFQGRPLVRYAAETLLASCVDEVIVVVGFAAAQVLGALDGLPLKIVVNRDFANGQSTSVRRGAAAIMAGPLPQGVLFALGDQPLIKPETINAIVTKFGQQGGIIVPCYENVPGNPVLFEQKYFTELERLYGDVGAREIVRRNNKDVYYLDVADRGILFDIDTLDDYRRLQETE